MPSGDCFEPPELPHDRERTEDVQPSGNDVEPGDDEEQLGDEES